MILKYAAYAFLLIMYAAFCWTGKAPVEGFIIVLTGIIASLGTSHAVSEAAKTATDAANHANPVPPPISPTILTREPS
jgi:hypothetical protein